MPAEDSMLGPSAHRFSMPVKLHACVFAIPEIVIHIDLGVVIVCIFYLTWELLDGFRPAPRQRALSWHMCICRNQLRGHARLSFCNLEPLLPPVCLSSAFVGPPDPLGRTAGWAGCGCSTSSVAALRCCKTFFNAFFASGTGIEET